MQHSGHYAQSLLNGYGQGCLIYFVHGRENHFSTDCEPSCLCWATDSPTHFLQDSQIHSARYYQIDSVPDFSLPDFPLHFWPE